MKPKAYERHADRFRMRHSISMTKADFAMDECPEASMGLAPGGRMRQEIYDDPHRFEDWNFAHTSRCWVHLANSIAWRAITGEAAPTMPPTAAQYSNAGLPWFDYYSEGSTAVKGSATLARLKSVLHLGKEKGESPLPENESVTSERVVELRRGLKQDQVREGWF